MVIITLETLLRVHFWFRVARLSVLGTPFYRFLAQLFFLIFRFLGLKFESSKIQMLLFGTPSSPWSTYIGRLRDNLDFALFLLDLNDGQICSVLIPSPLSKLTFGGSASFGHRRTLFPFA